MTAENKYQNGYNIHKLRLEIQLQEFFQVYVVCRVTKYKLITFDVYQNSDLADSYTHIYFLLLGSV